MDIERYKKILRNVSNISYDKVKVYSSAVQEDNDTVVIFNIHNKNIEVPIGMQTLLVQGDKDSRRIHFVMNRYFDGADLSEKDIFIKYVNSNNAAGYDEINNFLINGDTIEYDWLVSENATGVEGELNIQVEINEMDETEDIIYRYQTKPIPIVVEKTIMVGDDAEPIDYYYDIVFLNDFVEEKIFGMSSTLPTITIDEKNIVMPMLENVAITRDTNSRLLTFQIKRYIDYVDLANRTIVFKFLLPDGKTGGRSFVCNKKVSDTSIEFSWLIDSRVTSQIGKVTFSIEVIGYNEEDEFYCWNTLPSYFFVLEGLKDFDNFVDPPSATWIQGWNILADKYLNEFVRYNEQTKKEIEEYNKKIENLLFIINDLTSRIEILESK